MRITEQLAEDQLGREGEKKGRRRGGRRQSGGGKMRQGEERKRRTSLRRSRKAYEQVHSVRSARTRRG